MAGAGERPLEHQQTDPGEVTVVILSAGHSPHLDSVLQSVWACEPRPDRLLVVWSGPSAPPSTVEALSEVVAIPPESFDHGSSRQLALDQCRGGIVAFLSDDAEPVDAGWLASLLRPFADPAVGVVYGRQIARPGAGLAERTFRKVRYSTTPMEFDAKRLADTPAMLRPPSNANAGYRVRALRKVGGFPSPCRFAEDQIVLQRLLDVGWRAYYEPEASVWHSHRLSARAIMQRGWHNGLVGRPTAHRGVSGGLMSSLTSGVRLIGRMTRVAFTDHGPLGVVAVWWVTGLRAAPYVVARLVPDALVGRSRRNGAGQPTARVVPDVPSRSPLNRETPGI